MFVASRRARRKTTVISLCQYRSIIGALCDLIEYENNWRAVTTRNRIMQHCVQSGLWAKKKKKVLAPLRQKKQPEQATHPEASLYLNTHLDSVLCCVHHSKGCWSLHRTRRKTLSLHGELQRSNADRRRMFTRKPDLVRWKVLIIFQQFLH